MDDPDHLGVWAETLDDDGDLPTDAALAIVAARWDGLDGVEPAALDGLPVEAPVLALRSLIDDPDALEPDRRAQVQAIFDDHVLGRTAGPGNLRRGPAAPVVPRRDVAEIEALGERIRVWLQAQSGHRLSIPIRYRVTDQATDDFAEAWPNPGVDPEECVVLIRPAGAAQTGDGFESTLAHEVWHCFQFDAAGRARPGPDWVVEGAAEWVGEFYVSGTADSSSRWTGWLGIPERALYRRSYDAIGLYALAHQNERPPWSSNLQMLGKPNDEALRILFGSDHDATLRTIAKAVTRTPSWGDDWESTGPGITSVRVTADGTAGVDAPYSRRFDLAANGTRATDVTVGQGAVLRVTLKSAGLLTARFTDADLFELDGPSTLDLCLLPEGCECPQTGSKAAAGPGSIAVATKAKASVELTVEVLAEETCDVDAPAEGELGGSIVGTWEMDLGSTLEVNGTGGCTGFGTLTFHDDGALDAGQNPSDCPGIGSGTIDVSGRYEVDGNQVTLELSGTATAAAGGSTFEVPIDVTVTATVTIDGDAMTTEYDSGGQTYTVTYHRVD